MSLSQRVRPIVTAQQQVPHTLWNTRDHWKYDDDYDADKAFSTLHTARGS